MAQYRTENRDRISAYNAEYETKNKAKIAAKGRRYWQQIKDKPGIKESRAAYLAGYIGKYNKERRTRDPQFKVLMNLRRRLNHAVKGKSNKTKHYLGCTIEELRAHLEKQFQTGMTWENYGYRGWHIDHKKPFAAFQLVNADGSINEEAIHASMHYTNLQPLWQWQNAAKSDSLTFNS